MTDMDRLREDVGEIKVAVVEMKADLKYHIRRTDLLEDKFRPVEDHVRFIRQLMKSATWFLGLSATILSIIKLLKG